MTTSYKYTLATGPQNAGKVLLCGCPFSYVVCVPYGEPADIEKRQYTRGYEALNSRPFMLSKSRRQFASLKSAVAALKRERGIG